MVSDSDKLKLIYRYYPRLAGFEEYIDILEKMGLSLPLVRELLENGRTATFYYIADPDTGIIHKYIDNLSIINIELREIDGKRKIYINNLPYKDFFSAITKHEEWLKSVIAVPDTNKCDYLLEYVDLQCAVNGCDETVRTQVHSRLREIAEKKSNTSGEK